MRVYFLQDQLRGGGTERQSIELARGLLSEGLDVQLLVGRRGGVLDDLAIETLGGQVLFLGNSAPLYHWQALQKLLSLPADPPSLLICMGRWAHLIAALQCHRKNLRVISTIRGSRGLPFLYRHCIRQSTQLITNSHWASDYAARCLPVANLPPRAVIHNPLSRPDLLSITPSERSEARRRLGIDPDTFLLLNVSRMEAGKGQADLIRALAETELHNAKLWLLGEGPKRNELENLASHLGLGDTVVFKGFKHDPRPYYAAADLFVSASKLDSLPNALIEAHAAGLPIIAYPTAGIPEIVEHEVTGILCDEECPSEISRWINYAGTHTDWRLRLGENARKKIETEFSRERLHNDFRKLILKILPT